MAVSRLSQNSIQSGFSKSQNIWDGRTAVAAMDAISSVTLQSNQLIVNFNNIPQTYTHLQLRISASHTAGGNNFGFMRINDSISGYYALHQMYSDGTSVVSNAPNAATDYMETGYYPDNTSIFGTTIMDILDYSNSNKFKTVRNLGGFDLNGSGFVLFRSGLWQNTNSINSISLFVTGSNSYRQNSVFSLYGIK